MPRNNPYDKELSPRRQLISNIGLGVTVLMVVAFILWVIFSQPKNVRTKLDHLQIPVRFADSAGEKNEFSEFLLTLNSPQGISPVFIEKFPLVTALLKREAPLFRENIPYVLCSGDIAAVALSYNSTAVQNVVSMDVLLVPYQKISEGVSIAAPVRYSVSYNTSTGVIEQTELRTDAYRLSFYSFTVSLETDGKVEYHIDLSAVISDKEAEAEGLLTGIRALPAGPVPVLTRNGDKSFIDGRVTEADFTNPASILIPFGDIYYEYFNGITLKSDRDISNITFTLN